MYCKICGAGFGPMPVFNGKAHCLGCSLKLLEDTIKERDSLQAQRDVLLAAGRRYVQQYTLVNKKVMGVTARMIHDAVAQVEGKG